MKSSAYRQLYILNALQHHKQFTKVELAEHFDTSFRTIQRDISALNGFFEGEGLDQRIDYNSAQHTFELQLRDHQLTNAQILVTIKIILANRALNVTETNELTDALRQLVSPDQRLLVDRIINIESFDYAPLQHNQPLIDRIWDFSQFILKGESVKMSYGSRLQQQSTPEILPKAIFFSEFYFYLIATDLNAQEERFYRIDRIQEYKRLKRPRVTTYANRYDEGALRKNIPFMYNGPAEDIVFEFWGIEEAALDRLPSAKVIARHPHPAPARDSVTIRAHASDKGLKMWVLSQGNMLKVLSPQHFVDEVKDVIAQMQSLYNGDIGNHDGEQPRFFI
ncbi:helix-turn-helix transcriptional regulator [Lacticaseibacillus saniviri]|uniref:WYL domain-containing protein n=3 Tax=Lacticaseibacillus saniviri TaxID=931533 RepID=A0A0R2MNB5_9LACO|nr:WYL domain-containing protein [Lacticaseibacillus saniviri]KRO15188.1 hypothetical protein IV56_GL000279 [Lacticaseibacillus saniviri JCM 17471 = DSM 24301]